MSEAANCDFIAEPGNPLCLLPFPDDYYTVSDPASPTGRRVNLTTAGMPANAFGKHIDAAPYNASDGFSPGAAILLKVPGIDTVADVQATGAAPVNHIGRYRTGQRPGRRDRRQYRQALADLERDRLDRDRPREGRAGDPPGRQLRLRPPLHRRPAPPPQRRRAEARSPGRLPLLPRPRALETAGDQRPPRPLRGDLLAPAALRHPAQRPLPRLGLHRRQRPEQRRPRAGDARRRLRPARRHQPRRRRASGHLPELPGDRRRNRPQPRPDRPSGQGQLRGALLPVPELRCGWHLPARRRRSADPERHLDRQLRLHRPRLSGHRTGRRGSTVAVWARALRRRRRGRFGSPAQPLPGTWDRPVRDR